MFNNWTIVIEWCILRQHTHTHTQAFLYGCAKYAYACVYKDRPRATTNLTTNAVLSEIPKCRDAEPLRVNASRAACKTGQAVSDRHRERWSVTELREAGRNHGHSALVPPQFCKLIWCLSIEGVWRKHVCVCEWRSNVSSPTLDDWSCPAYGFRSGLVCGKTFISCSIREMMLSILCVHVHMCRHIMRRNISGLVDNQHESSSNLF